MVVADTNVWARAHLNDDQAQARKARRDLAEAQGKGGVFVPILVLAEPEQLLRTREQWHWRNGNVAVSVSRCNRESRPLGLVTLPASPQQNRLFHPRMAAKQTSQFQTGISGRSEHRWLQLRCHPRFFPPRLRDYLSHPQIRLRGIFIHYDA